MSELSLNSVDHFQKYELTDDAVLQLTADFLQTKKMPEGERFVCFRVSGNDPIADVGRNLERQVFEETFPGNDAQFMSNEYGPYESTSTFFISFDRQTQTPSGVLRVIWDSHVGLKTLNDVTEPDSSLQLTRDQVSQFHHIDVFHSCWDIGTVAIPKELRRSGANISTQLYRGMYKTALENGIEHFVAIIDEGPLLAMTDYLSIPFVPLCDSAPFSYLESPVSQAVYGHVTEFDEIINRKLASIAGDSPYEQGVRKALNKVFKGSEDQSLCFTNDDY